jgi:hypothetical protein
VEHRDRVILVVQMARDPVGAILGAAKNQHLIIIGAAQKFFEQRLLLSDIDRIQCMGDGLSWHAALADLDSLRIVQRPAA